MNYSFIIKPLQILFENKHMDGLFTKGKKYDELTNKLILLGYIKEFENDEDTMFRLESCPYVDVN